MKETLHIYTRVSTDVQDDEGYGIPLQLVAGRTLASQLKFNIKHWNEGGQSSTKDDLQNRPVLKELLEDVKSGGINHLYVYNESRLSRNRATWYYIGNIIINAGIKLYYGTNPSPHDLSKAEDAFMFDIMRSVSMLEQSQRMERLGAGKFERVRQGKWQGGPTPYGYTTDDNGFLKVDDYEASWVKLIFNRYVEGKTILDIQQELFTNGVRTRRNNTEWSTASIRNIISKISHYNGSYNYTRHKTDETLTIQCEPIITKEVFETARNLFADRSYNSKGRIRDANIKTKTLLKDYLICGYCGKKYGQKTYAIQYRSHYYCRTKEFNNRTIENKQECKPRLQSLKIDKTDKLVWDTIVDILSDSHIFKETVKNDVMTATSFRMSSNQIKTINTKIKKTKKNIRQVNDLLKMDRAVKIESKAIKATRKTWLEQKKKWENELSNLHDQLVNSESNKKWLDWVKVFDDKIKILKNSDSTLEDKTTLLNQVLESITVFNDEPNEHQLKIEFKLPYILDKFEWNINKNKKEGYTISDGKKKVVIKISNEAKKNL